MAPGALPRPVLITGTEALAEACRRWRRLPAVAIDTEFVRERTFYPKLGLVQVASDEALHLVDPLALDLAPLGELLTDPGVTKVLHSASEDVEVFHHRLGTVPEPLFDTQVAATLAGYGPAPGYQKLVETLFGVPLHKGETRTDWLARPLSPAQVAYAAEDVAFLLPAYERLRAELAARGRLPWAEEDSAALTDTARLEFDPEEAWLRLRGRARLDRRQLATLQALAAWREREARRRDLPRNFVLRENALRSLARRRPAAPGDLRTIPDLDPRQAARDGATWLEIIRRVAALPASELPEAAPRPWPGVQESKDLQERLRARVRARAESLEIPPEVLASRRTVEAVARRALDPGAPGLPEELQGWRRAVVGDDLLAEVDAPERPR